MTQKFESHDPATLEVIWRGLEAGEEEVNQAFEEASEALDHWSHLSLKDRTEILLKYKEALTHTRLLLAEAISRETGKPLWESLTEVTAMINKVDISIKAFEMRCPEIKQQHGPILSITRHKPHGVVAVFGPYNFPGHLPNGHIVPALLAGNTVIFKPSEHTPLVGELMVKCWQQCGLPAGVLNLVQGAAETGKLISKHPKLNGLFFTGSWNTGKMLLGQFSMQPEKILALEMGGNNPLIYDKAMDIEAAAYFTIQSAYLTTGQRCTCARRLIVVEGETSEAFIQELMEQIKGIQIGAFTVRPEPFMGPLISETAAKKILDAQKMLMDKGAKVLAHVYALKPGTGFVTPGLIDVTDVPERPDEEYFGPFLQLIRVPNLQKAIEEANRTSFGLAAGILSDNPEAYRTFQQQIKAGIVNWNTQTTGASSSAPFGGIGHSGNFRPSAYYAADYCAYPIASLENEKLSMPEEITPGLLYKEE